jgi:hypothetical protein
VGSGTEGAALLDGEVAGAVVGALVGGSVVASTTVLEVAWPDSVVAGAEAPPLEHAATATRATEARREKTGVRRICSRVRRRMPPRAVAG